MLRGLVEVYQYFGGCLIGLIFNLEDAGDVPLKWQ
jgi:hypothetical protein